ncbi:DUF3789 domain-containing protein [Blautia producta]|uniref:DUF3789 domain-containing protein n=1 Tax=Blautia producta TaxID=33035 RepID=UPI0035BE571B
MWYLVTHFLSFTGGMSAGVVLMCLMQAAKQEDEWLENRKQEENGNRQIMMRSDIKLPQPFASWSNSL